MREADQVWAVIRPKLSPFGHLQRIESAATDLGIPDVNYCLRQVEGWIELKVGRLEGTKPRTLKLEQVTWAERRTEAGGRSYLLVRYLPAIWHLYDANGARLLYNDLRADPLVRSSGEFPLRAMLDVLAPL